MTFDFTVKLSNLLYEWIVDPRGDDSGESFNQLLSNNTGMGHGLEYCFFFLVGVSLLAAAIYYFVISSSVKAATKQNYIMTWIMGFIVLLIINFVGLQIIIPDADVFSSNNLENLIKISLIDVVYYTLLYEVWSLCMKGASKAPNIDLISIFFNK